MRQSRRRKKRWLRHQKTDKMGYYILCNKTDLDEFWNRPFEW